MPGGVTRRQLIGGAAAAGVGVLWAPALRLPVAQAADAAPAGFPSAVELFKQTYENWAQEIRVDGLWTCAPKTPEEAVAVVNWAATNGYRVRPRGMMHGWSPLTVVPGQSDRTILVDTTQHLTAMSLESRSPGVVRVQTGATMNALLGFLEGEGLGFTATPAPGDISIGGALAIDAHGTAIPARGETPVPGHTYGSLSNLILSLTAIVWSPKHGSYVLRRFDRSEHAISALMVHLGRTFVTEVELRTGANVNLRCQSILDIPATEMFAAPGSMGRTFASYIEEAGRAEAIWFPFTTSPWLKVWSVSPSKPAASRAVTAPYNYIFSDNIPVQVSDLATAIIKGDVASTPIYGQVQYEASVVGLPATQTADIWGPSKNTLLYIRPTTIRETANGYAIHCRRADIQRVVSEFSAFYLALVASYRARGLYPQNMPVEIRVTGLDKPGDVGVKGARSGALSALRPRHDHPERDVCVWIDVLTFVGTPSSQPFYRDVETWMFSNFRSYAHVRPEWSKGWAYSGTATWADPTVLGKTIPGAYRAGQKHGDNWDWALAELARHDPHGVFGNAFLDRLFTKRA